MLKILHIHDNFLPTRTGGALRLANILKSLDNSTEVICYLLLIKPGSKYFEVKVISGTKCISIPYYFLIPLGIIFCAFRFKINLIHAHNVRPLFYSIFFKLFYGFVVELHSMQQLGYLKECLLTILLKFANKIIVLTEETKKYLKNKYNLKSDIYVIKNCVSEDLDFHKPDINIFNDRTQFVYFGSFHEWQGVNKIIDALVYGSLFSNQFNFHMTFIGSGPELAYLKKSIIKHQLSENVTICSAIEGVKLYEVLKRFDYFIMPRIKTRATELTIPMKLNECILLKLPLVISDLPILRYYVKDHAHYVQPDVSDSDLFQVMKSLSGQSSRQKSRLMAKDLYELRKCEIDTWSSEAEKLINHYNDILYNF